MTEWVLFMFSEHSAQSIFILDIDCSLERKCVELCYIVNWNGENAVWCRQRFTRREWDGKIDSTHLYMRTQCFGKVVRQRTREFGRWYTNGSECLLLNMSISGKSPQSYQTYMYAHSNTHSQSRKRDIEKETHTHAHTLTEQIITDTKYTKWTRNYLVMDENGD